MTILRHAISSSLLLLNFANVPSGRLQKKVLRSNFKSLAIIFLLSLLLLACEALALGLIFRLITILAGTASLSVKENHTNISGLIENLNTIPVISMLLVLTQLFESFGRYAYTVVSGQISVEARCAVTTKINNTITSIPYEDFIGLTKGSLLTVASQGAEAFRFQIEELLTLLSSIALLASYLLVLLSISPSLLAISLALSSCLILLQKKLSPIIRRASINTAKESARLNSNLIDNFDSYEYYKITHERYWPYHYIAEPINSLRRSLLYRYSITGISSPLSKLLTVVMLAALLISGSFLFSDSSFRLAALGTFFVALQRFSGKVVDIIQILNSLSDNRGLLEYLNKYLNLSSSLPRQKSSDSLAINRQSTDFNKFVLKDVSYAYPGEPSSSISSINLEINCMDCVAIVGGSGSGKSTLIKLLTGLISPKNGFISLPPGFGQYSCQSHATSTISIITHKSSLFTASIAENIALLPGNLLNYELVEQCLRYVSLAEFVSTLSDGVHTMLGDSGSIVSSGQAQKIMIARALYRNPNFLILDEATSNLDAASESEICDTLKRLKSRCGMLVVAHRLPTVELCDYIYVMDKGSIVESGTYAALLDKNGLFCNLFSSVL